MKIEMHAHTSEASPCANVSATKIPALYQKAGYDAIVITDHYCKWAQDRSGLTDNDDYVQYFLNRPPLISRKNLSRTASHLY
jgi:hypothetical protein